MKISPILPLCATLACVGITSGVHAQSLPLAPASKEVLAELATGMELETEGSYLIVAPSTTMLGETKTDVHFGLKLSRQIAVYVQTPEGGLKQLVAVRHEAADRALALKVARLAARLLRVHKARVGEEATFPQGEERTELWLTRNKAPHNARAAAETRSNQVYFFDIADPRPDIEWARTIAHEWGHLILLAARGYKAPENDAAGFLGERLFLKWLYEESLAQTQATDDFCDKAGLKLYYERQVVPLMARYSASGPSDKRLDQRDAVGMDYYIGMALDADETFGSKVAGFALYHLEDTTPRALVNAVQNGVFLQTELRVKVPAWVPLAPDTYTVSGPAGKILLDVRPLNPAKPIPFKVLAPGYKRLKAVSGKVPAVVLRRGAPKK